MCGTRQGFPTGLSRGASRAALSSCCFVLEPIQREPVQHFAPARGGISPLLLARFLKLLFWDESQMIYILLTHDRPPVTQPDFSLAVI